MTRTPRKRAERSGSSHRHRLKAALDFYGTTDPNTVIATHRSDGRDVVAFVVLLTLVSGALGYLGYAFGAGLDLLELVLEGAFRPPA